jgi:hypothetical protein
MAMARSFRFKVGVQASIVFNRDLNGGVASGIKADETNTAESSGGVRIRAAEFERPLVSGVDGKSSNPLCELAQFVNAAVAERLYPKPATACTVDYV